MHLNSEAGIWVRPSAGSSPGKTLPAQRVSSELCKARRAGSEGSVVSCKNVLVPPQGRRAEPGSQTAGETAGGSRSEQTHSGAREQGPKRLTENHPVVNSLRFPRSSLFETAACLNSAHHIVCLPVPSHPHGGVLSVLAEPWKKHRARNNPCVVLALRHPSALPRTMICSRPLNPPPAKAQSRP